MRGGMGAQWIDLLDPSHDELAAAAPRELELLLADAKHDDEPRATLQSHGDDGDDVVGVLLLARAVLEENCVYYQEVDVVITRDTLVTVRKTPSGRQPFDLAPIRGAVKKSDSAGMIAYRLVDNIAEAYLDLVDDVDAEIDELEDAVESQPAEATRERISEIRHGLLHIRRTLTPMRDAVRRVVDDVVEHEEGHEVFPHDVEVAFNGAYDKLSRALHGLELSCDLLASVRDHHRSKIANDQNDVLKRLTVIASLLLLPTFIVGRYGERLHSHAGYGFAWGVIAATTLVQLWFYRRRSWI